MSDGNGSPLMTGLLVGGGLLALTGGAALYLVTKHEDELLEIFGGGHPWALAAGGGAAEREPVGRSSSKRTFRVTMKDPDALRAALEEQAGDKQWRARAEAAAKKWLEYGEYLTLDINIDNGTCRVVPVAR